MSTLAFCCITRCVSNFFHLNVVGLFSHFLRSFIEGHGLERFFFHFDVIICYSYMYSRRDCIPANGKVTVLVLRSLFSKYN